MNHLPTFSQIDPSTIEPTVLAILADNKKKLDTLLTQKKGFTWQNLMQPLEDMNDNLHQYWSPVAHLHSVMESDDLRKAYHATLQHITAYHTEISQNEDLYNAISSIANSAEFANLNPAQQKILQNDIRDFKLAGIHLSKEKKARIAELQVQLCQLTTTFSENILDATQGFTIHLKNKEKLEGLPATALQLATDNAKLRHLDGYVLTLDYPSYSTAMKFLKDRDLRKTLYEAYTTRASDRGPNACKWDNTPVMNDILKARHELAQLVDFKNFAEYSLATKMAKKPDEVLNFLQDLLQRSKPIAKSEYAELLELAKKQDGITTLFAWDAAYYSEKLRESLFNFSQEDLRVYFPIDTVMQGMFTIVNKLYGITVQREEGIDLWHNDAHFYKLYDEDNQLRAGFYIDLYARSHKRDGAWMDECRVRRRMHDKKIQYPVAYLTCNFMPPAEHQQALLTHDDVITLFHEFGHCLHHMLSTVDYAPVSGINGVAWDAVEFPSQFMENYCWEKESLALIAKHYQTHQPLPDDLFKKMMAAKHFQTGLQMVRQLEFSIFDFRLHLEYAPTQSDFIQTLLNEVRKQTAVIPVPELNRFQHSFSHIFAGGYAAGYYSYKWAEVLSSDAYAEFENHGIFNKKTGQSFMKNILEMGGVRDAMDSFIAFRGRKPTIDALLRHSGMISE